ncbi:hypothetical protein ACWEVT_42465, partial [Saccharopolyspora sp. NPDC003762]
MCERTVHLDRRDQQAVHSSCSALALGSLGSLDLITTFAAEPLIAFNGLPFVLAIALAVSDVTTGDTSFDFAGARNFE